MALLLSLYNYDGEPNRVDKASKIASIRGINGTFQMPESVIDPVIEIYDDITTGGTGVLLANYMYIPELKRYYFITNIETVRTNVWRIYGHVDVLMTYKDDIDNLTGVVQRSENKWNGYLLDPLMKTYQYTRTIAKKFAGGTITAFSYDTDEYYMLTTG